ncbi:MAG: DUF1674 domain-containing protein [Rickettsiales bacterium]|jgi:hypothetical protein|nr:DUF1674 domain-containing protein [Rickettsiales bacterium]
MDKQEDNKTVKPKLNPKPQTTTAKAAETGGPKGPEPTRYGDWEIAGKCVDF